MSVPQETRSSHYCYPKAQQECCKARATKDVSFRLGAFSLWINLRYSEFKAHKPKIMSIWRIGGGSDQTGGTGRCLGKGLSWLSGMRSAQSVCGSPCRTRTGTSKGKRILSPQRLPIPPRGQPISRHDCLTEDHGEINGRSNHFIVLTGRPRNRIKLTSIRLPRRINSILCGQSSS